jgi:hypothetical protein
MTKTGIMLVLYAATLAAVTPDSLEMLNSIERNQLAGLDSVQVVIDLVGFADTCLSKPGLRARMTAEVERAGIEVVESPGPFLHLHVIAMQRDLDGVMFCASYTSLELEQPASLDRNSALGLAALRLNENLGLGPSSAFVQNTNDKVDQFTSDLVISYLLANKRK